MSIRVGSRTHAIGTQNKQLFSSAICSERCGAGSAEEREAGNLQPRYCTYLGLDVATMCLVEDRVPERWVTSFLLGLRKK